MNNSKLSSNDMLKTLGCFIFDFALILAYFKVFGLFFIINPGKSILILFVLLVGLIIFNGAVIFPSMLFKRIGIPHSASIATVFVLYAIVANILSIFLIPGSIVWYIVWELIIFATFIVTFSIIVAFSRNVLEDNIKAEKEQADKTSIMLQLLEIDDLFIAKGNQKAILQCFDCFKALRERIEFSTPFGRISGNNAVLEVEDKIKNNLVSLKVGLQGNLTDKNLVELQSLVEGTRRLVINRETLNIK
jgi:hypothetical protein